VDVPVVRAIVAPTKAALRRSWRFLPRRPAEFHALWTRQFQVTIK